MRKQWMIDNMVCLKLWVFVIVLLVLVAVLAVSGHAQEPTLPAVPLYFHNSIGEACVQYPNGCVRCVTMDKPQEKPILTPRKHFWVDRLFWYGVALQTAAVVADMHSTAMVIDNCPHCVESSLLTSHIIGTRPAHHKLILWGAGMSTLYAIEAYQMRKYEKLEHLPGLYLGFPAIYTPYHGVAAFSNYNLAFHLTANQRR